MKNQKEVWKDVKNYEGFYQVSNLGRVKSLDRKVSNGKVLYYRKGVILKQGVCGRDYKTKPYYKVSLSGKDFTIHSLVAQSFLDYAIDGTNKLVVDHIDNNRANNNVCNLRILTNRQNLSRYKNKSSKYTGVHYHKTNKKYQANIWVNGKKKYLGSFSNEVDAYNAYNNELNNLRNGN